MTEPSTHDIEMGDLLADVIADARTRPATADFELGQVYGGIVAGNEYLERIWSRETGPEQARLDLHLTGEGVTGHTTSAKHLGAFARAISRAVKHVAKDALGIGKYSENLLIEGMQPGSVRVVFRVPDQPIPANESPLAGTQASSQDSEALRTTAMILAAAVESEALDDDVLSALIADLPPEARVAIKSAATTAKASAWLIDGRLEQRGHDPERVSLNPMAAQKLISAVENNPTAERKETLVGTLDGFSRATGRAQIATTTGLVYVAVPDPELMEKVADLAAERDTPIKATITVFETIAEGRSEAIRVSRRLDDIARRGPDPSQATIDDEIAQVYDDNQAI